MIYSFQWRSWHAPDYQAGPRRTRPLLTGARRGRKCLESRRTRPLKLNRQRHTTRERGPQSRRESRTFQVSTWPGCRRGDSLSRSGATPTLTPHASDALLPSEEFSVSADFKPLLRRARRSHVRSAEHKRKGPPQMNSANANTSTPHWRTTHARVLRARARLRQLHRTRQGKSSRNG